MDSYPETNLFYTDTTLNLAHRGASHHAPENTLPAFRLAAEMGAHGIELDAQCTKDGEVVIFHDWSLERLTAGQGRVPDKTLAELKELEAGSHFSPEFSGTPIPTLQEVMLALGPVLLFNIELKTVALRDDGLVAETIRLIEDHHMQDRVLLSSFNPLALMTAYRLNPKIKRGLLWGPELPFFLRWQLFRPLARPHMFHPYWQAATPAMIKKEHARNVPVNAWTCNESQGMHELLRRGVDSIITDRPDLLRQILDGAEAS